MNYRERIRRWRFIWGNHRSARHLWISAVKAKDSEALQHAHYELEAAGWIVSFADVRPTRPLWLRAYCWTRKRTTRALEKGDTPRE
jgi:hypothetical protein